MPNPHTALLTALAQAPDGAIAASITTRLAALAQADAVASDAVLAVLDDCAYGALANDAAMGVLDRLWRTLVAAEGLTVEAAVAAARARREARHPGLAKASEPAPAPEPEIEATAETLAAALYGPGVDEARSREVAHLFRILNSLFWDGRFAVVDAALRDLDTDRVATTLALGLLRFSTAAKDHLPHRAAAAERLRGTLVARGKDPERLLVGLLPDR